MEIYDPTVDYKFLFDIITSSDKLEDKIQVGNTTAFILKGASPSHKRTLYLRRTEDEQVPFLKATGLMIRMGKLPSLLDWYESNRDWKDGEYFVRQRDKNNKNEN